MWTLARASSWSLGETTALGLATFEREGNQKRDQKVLCAGEVQEPPDGNESAALSGSWRAQVQEREFTGEFHVEYVSVSHAVYGQHRLLARGEGPWFCH